MFATLISILSQKRYLITVIIVFLLYVLIYLAATQFLILAVRIQPAEGFFEIEFSENWQDLIFRQRAPFIFESIGVLYLGGIKLFISVPNMLIAILLGILVAFNIAISYYSLRALSLRGVRGFVSLLSTLPAIVSGAACCVPTLILVIGLQLTAALVMFWSFFVPLSFILLVASLWWGLYKIKNKKL